MATNFQVRQGIDSYLLYGEEATYGTEASTIQSNFGMITSFGAKPSRSLVEIRGVQSVLPTANTAVTGRDVQQYLRGRFVAPVSVSFMPFDFAFLKYVFGTVSGSGTAGSLFNYPRATASTEAEKKSYSKVPSMTLSTNYYFGGSSANANKAWKFLGGKVNSCTIKGNVGEAISVDLEIPTADMKGNTTLDTPVALSGNDVYHFTGASLEIPSATPVAEIFESFTATITNNIELLYGMGTDVAQQASELARTFGLQVVLTAEGTKYLDYFMGGATSLSAPTNIGTVKLTLTAGTNRNVVLYALNCRLDPISLTDAYGQVIKQTIDLKPTLIYITEQTTA